MRGRKPTQQLGSPNGNPPEAPPDLSAPELQIWDRLLGTPGGGLLDESDSACLRSLVEAIHLHSRLRRELADAPLLVTGFGGSSRINPLLEESRRIRSQIHQLSAGLGFSPTSRRGAVAPATPPVIDPDQAFLDSL